MKRILFILTALFLFTFVSANTSNAAVIVKQNIEYLPDGSYYETTITTKEDIRFLSLGRTASASRSGNKTTTYTSSSGAKLWSVTVTGNFSYVKGKSSKCTSSSVSWKISNKSSSKSGNTATASATVLQYSGTRPVNSVTRKVSLTCDVNGILS